MHVCMYAYYILQLFAASLLLQYCTYCTHLARFRKNGFQNRPTLSGIQVEDPSFVHNDGSAVNRAGFSSATKAQKPYAKHLVHAKEVGQHNQPDNNRSKHEKGVFVCSTGRRSGFCFCFCIMRVGFLFLFLVVRYIDIVQQSGCAPEEQDTVCGHCRSAVYRYIP
jgi:hypothetical protein